MFKVALRIFIVSISIFAIFGCSSGGKNSDSKTPQPAPMPPVEYSGSAELGSLNRSNASEVIFGFFRLMTEAYYGATLINPFVIEPDILLYDSFESDGECETGDIQVNERLTPAGNYTVEIKINNCKTKTLLNKIFEVGYGEITYVSTNSSAINYRAHLPYFSITSPLDSLEFTMAANSSTERVVIEKAVMKSKTLEKFFMLENLVFENDSSGTGKLYVSSYGYFDVQFDGRSDTLNISGADGTELQLSYKMGFTASGADILYDLTAQLIVPSEQFSPFISRIEGSNLLNYQVYFLNDMPKAEPTEVRIDRLGSVILNADHIKDNNYDFLKFDWALATQRYNCQTELLQTENHKAQFSSDCAGEFVVAVAADDGRGGAGVGEIHIQVLPFPADFLPLEKVELELDQAMDVQLMPTNVITDGPFVYSSAYMPRGINISADGKLSGRPESLILGGEQHFKIGINVDNGRNTLVELEISAKNEPKPFSLFSGDVHCTGAEGYWWDYDMDGAAELLCEYFGSFLILEISGDNQMVEYIEVNPPKLKLPLALNYTQFDESPEYELVIVYADETVIIDSITKEIRSSIAHPMDLYDMSIFPSIDGAPGFFLEGSGNNRRQLFFYDAALKNFSEIGADSSLKILHQAQGRLNAAEREIVFQKLQDVPLSQNSHLADVDGDGSIDLVTIEYSGSSREPHVTAINLATDSVFNYPALAVDYALGAVLFVDIDGDAPMELVATDVEYDHLTIFDWIEGEIHTRVVDLPESCQMYMAQLVPTGLPDVPLLIKSVRSSNLDICKVDSALMVRPLGPELAYPIREPYPIGVGLFDLAGNIKASFLDDDRYPFQLNRLTFSPNGELLSAIAHEVDLNYRVQPAIKRNPATGSPVSITMFGIQSGVYEYDFETFELLNQWQVSSLLSIEKLTFADMNQDGVEELILFEQSSASIPQMTVLDMHTGQNRTLTQPRGQFLTAVDMDGDGVMEFIFQNYGSVTIYSPQADTLVAVASQNVSETFPPVSDLIFGVQDVNGDASLELIVTGTSVFGCRSGEAFPLLTLDAELKPVFRSSQSECIQSIPNMPSSGDKKNLIAYAGLSSAQTGASPAFNAIIEIDVGTGKSIWQSRPLLGRLNPDSLNFSAIVGGTKSVVTEAGLYIFQ